MFFCFVFDAENIQTIQYTTLLGIEQHYLLLYTKAFPFISKISIQILHIEWPCISHTSCLQWSLGRCSVVCTLKVYVSC